MCVCLPGYTDFGGICARCPEGQIYSDSEQKCILPCGINEVESNGVCVCKEGYGKFETFCQICPTGFFAANNYCASCPIGSTYNSVTK